jgi:hypothetical protein
MSVVLWIGVALGAVIGLFQMLYIFVTRLGRPGLSTAKTLWQGVWTWALWTLFGAYVLAFWMLGAGLLGVSRLLGHRRHAQ